MQPITDPPDHVPQRTNRVGLTQAYQIRDFAADSIMELKDEPCDDLESKLARAKAVQALASVWTDATDKIRIIRGQPLPGSLRPQAKPTKKPRTRAIPSESPQDTPNSG